MTNKMVVEKNQIGCHFQNGRRPKGVKLKNAIYTCRARSSLNCHGCLLGFFYEKDVIIGFVPI
jgi:hypothetical protein